VICLYAIPVDEDTSAPRDLPSRGQHVVTERARRGRLLTVVGQQPAKAKFADSGQMQAVKGSAMPSA